LTRIKGAVNSRPKAPPGEENYLEGRNGKKRIKKLTKGSKAL